MSSEQQPVRPVVGVQVIVFDHEAILLGQRQNSFGAGTWGLPGGHLEFGESFEDAAARELVEETGLVARELRTIRPINTPYERTHYVQIAVEVLRYDGVPEIKEPDRCSGLDFFPMTKLPTPLFPPSVDLVESLRIRNTPPAETSLCVYLYNRNSASGMNRYVSYILFGDQDDSSIILARQWQEGEHSPRQGRTHWHGDFHGALDTLRSDIARKIEDGYHLLDCSGTVGLNAVKSLFPNSYHVGVSPIVEDRPNMDRYDTIMHVNAQQSLFGEQYRKERAELG